jgi:hypothetical protein
VYQHFRFCQLEQAHTADVNRVHTDGYDFYMDFTERFMMLEERRNSPHSARRELATMRGRRDFLFSGTAALIGGSLHQGRPDRDHEGARHSGGGWPRHHRIHL